MTSDLAESLKQSDVVYLADFTGLNVKGITELRRRFRETGTRFIVVKNRLALRALEQLDLPDLSDYLRGPTGFILGSDDPIVPAKTVLDFAKENDNRPVLKAGVVEKRAVTAAQITELADLPPREHILAGIAGSLDAPISGIVGVLNNLMAFVAQLIEEVARKQEAGGD
ncbi:MAG: 50S ribosomal protein L10 [Gemmatimonadota bacterium]|nr:MAG: 50S ribosomal protein L10 [Gemmatimonadota bacterium]